MDINVWPQGGCRASHRGDGVIARRLGTCQSLSPLEAPRARTLRSRGPPPTTTRNAPGGVAS
eukprot:4010358-Lingulodinium_polyedra.AAC.1